MLAALLLAGLVVAPLSSAALFVPVERPSRTAGVWPATRRLLHTLAGTAALAAIVRLSLGQRWAYLAGAIQWYGDLLGLVFFLFLLVGAVNLATEGDQLFRKLTAFLVATVPVLVALGLVRAVALLRRGTGASWRDALGAFFVWQSTSLVVARASVQGTVRPPGRVPTHAEDQRDDDIMAGAAGGGASQLGGEPVGGARRARHRRGTDQARHAQRAAAGRAARLSGARARGGPVWADAHEPGPAAHRGPVSQLAGARPGQGCLDECGLFGVVHLRRADRRCRR